MAPLPFLGEPASPVAATLLGGLLLLAGRKVFWLAVGVTGFAFGLALAIQYLRLESFWLHVTLAVLAGVLGVLLAFFVQRLAVAVAGFLLGGQGGLLLWQALEVAPDLAPWMVFVAAGLVVSILAGSLFEMALVLLSAVVGANLVVDAWGGQPPWSLLIIVLLALFGAFVQLTFLEREKR
ncbi:MAG: hypothetical protein AAF604_11475 [Acidobacteriota bacterium]